MMIIFLCLALLMLSLCIALWRCFRTKRYLERLLAIQLMGTITVGLCLLLLLAMNMPALADVALILAILAIITALTVSQHDTKSGTGISKSNHTGGSHEHD